MPRHFPVLRLLVPIAALASGVSLVAGLVAAVTLLAMGIAGGRPLGGAINGLAAVAAGVAAAFSLAALGEAAEVLLELHASLAGTRSVDGGPPVDAAARGHAGSPSPGPRRDEQDHQAGGRSGASPTPRMHPAPDGPATPAG